MSRRLDTALATCAPAAASGALYFACYRWVPAWLFPLLLAAPLFPPFASAVRRGSDGRALAGVLVWAAVLAACATGVSMHQPLEAERAILNSRAYAEQTVAWVRTGQGMEQSPGQFVPRHLAELAVFSALSLASGGAGGLALGAALLNYMAFYVAALWRLSSGAPAALFLGWPPWALVRVAAYAALGTALARPLLSRLRRPAAPPPAPFSRRLLALGLAGVALDLLLKALLAPTWRLLLVRALGAP